MSQIWAISTDVFHLIGEVTRLKQKYLFCFGGIPYSFSLLTRFWIGKFSTFCSFERMASTVRCEKRIWCEKHEKSTLLRRDARWSPWGWKLVLCRVFSIIQIKTFVRQHQFVIVRTWKITGKQPVSGWNSSNRSLIAHSVLSIARTHFKSCAMRVLDPRSDC